MMLINGSADTRIAADDRGLAYGDGVFRTLEWRNGQPRLWPWQFRCLDHDARALGLAVPDEPLLRAEITRAAAGLEHAVVKIVLTRGGGQRGYAVPADPVPTRIVAASAWHGYPDAWAAGGVALTVCSLRLATQPRLAGIKHLNRLENVLARSELTGRRFQEGLLLDADGHLVEATAGNLFWRQGRRWYTPRLDRCGVAGAVRAWLLDRLSVEHVRTGLPALASADELFVCNSLAGILPVRELDGRLWSGFRRTRVLAEALAREE